MNSPTPDIVVRRSFLARLATAGSALAAVVALPSTSSAQSSRGPTHPADAWLDDLKGQHKNIFDCISIETGPTGWTFARNFLTANTGPIYQLKDADVNAIVCVRHLASVFGFNDAMWAKYKLGEVFKVNDPATNAPSVHNFFYKAPPGTWPIPGMGIDELMASGALFGACNMAIKFYSGIVGKQMNLKPEDVANDWRANLLPTVQVVPSGVWAVNRVQELGCTYCFAG